MTGDPRHPSLPDQAPDLPRSIGFWGATGVMVAVIIGSGIFKAPPEIAGWLSDPWMVLVFWLGGGLLALCGALTYAELAVLHPRAGGVYVFLRQAYGDATGFVFGWAYMLLIKPFAAGGIAIVFAEHFNALLGITFEPRVETCIALVLLTAINARGTVLATGVAGMMTIIKAGALVAVVVGAAAAGRFAAGFMAPAPPPAEHAGVIAAAVAVLSVVLWSYDGWSDAGSLAGEVTEPRRTLPRVLILGTLAVTALYVAVNAAFFAVVPLAEMRGRDTIAPLVGQRLIGDAGAVLMSVVIIVSTIGSSHASILTGARVTWAQSRDGLMFGFLSRVSRRGTPAVALWVQCALSCTAVLALGGFAELAGGFVFCMWIFYGLAGAAIFVERVRRPEAPRSYRCVGYPVVPAVFVIGAAIMTAASVYNSPRTTLPWLAVLLAGWPIYHAWRRSGGGQSQNGAPHSGH
ncbi:MAG: amino acid permease [Phycisphaeraceae bacterium]|nr:amino acid permease [Phycisphaeraceae bacterium]